MRLSRNSRYDRDFTLIFSIPNNVWHVSVLPSPQGPIVVVMYSGEYIPVFGMSFLPDIVRHLASTVVVMSCIDELTDPRHMAETISELCGTGIGHAREGVQESYAKMAQAAQDILSGQLELPDCAPSLDELKDLYDFVQEDDCVELFKRLTCESLALARTYKALGIRVVLQSCPNEE